MIFNVIPAFNDIKILYMVYYNILNISIIDLHCYMRRNITKISNYLLSLIMVRNIPYPI